MQNDVKPVPSSSSSSGLRVLQIGPQPEEEKKKGKTIHEEFVLTNIVSKTISGTSHAVACGYVISDPNNPSFRRFVFYALEYLDATNFGKFRVKTEHNLEINAPVETFGDL